MASDISKIGSALIDAFNAHDIEVWARQLAPGFSADYPNGVGLNAERARAYNQAFLTAFPDIEFHIRRKVVSEDHVVIEWTAKGTHTAPLVAPTGETIPPTGRRITETAILIAEVRNGRIVREATYWNLLSLLNQLGVLPQR